MILFTAYPNHKSTFTESTDEQSEQRKSVLVDAQLWCLRGRIVVGETSRHRRFDDDEQWSAETEERLGKEQDDRAVHGAVDFVVERLAGGRTGDRIRR